MACRCASIDGDADRLVYFTRLQGQFVLLDGDRIAALAALLVRDLVAQLQRTTPVTVSSLQNLFAKESDNVSIFHVICKASSCGLVECIACKCYFVTQLPHLLMDSEQET